MVTADEERAKKAHRKQKSPKYMNEMGWALAVACSVALLLAFTTKKVAPRSQAFEGAQRPPHRTRPPASRVSHPELDLAAMLEEEKHGVDSAAPTPPVATLPPQSVETAAPSARPTLGGQHFSADDGPTPIPAQGPSPLPADNDPMPAEGPTPIVAQGPSPLLIDEGPTPIEPLGPSPVPPEPPVSTPPPAPSGPSLASAGTVPWPRGLGNQPPTPNPVLDEVFTAERIRLFEENDRRRAAHTKDLTTKFGTFGVCPESGILSHCWNDTTYKPMETCPCMPEMCCTRKGRLYVVNHQEDNKTNWDMSRRDFCKKLRDSNQKTLPSPPELVDLTNLTALDMGVGQPFPSGSPQGELPFDPVVVQNLFFKAQAAIALYAEGTIIFSDKSGSSLRPAPTETEYPDMVNALARRFAAALIRGGKFVLAGNGDSTMAGADNCYYDNFLSVIERQLKPLLAAAKVDFTVRNCGHNGGYNSLEQLTCAGTMLGMEDADLAIISFPYVHPTNEEASYELFLRRALAGGTIPNIGGNSHHRTYSWLVPAYARFGVTAGPEGYGGYTTNRGIWWPPANGHGTWGRIGDGLCHTDFTRSGSAPVHSRNWHPGPQGHQAMADRFLFLYMTAIIQALEMIKTDIADSGGELAPLLKNYKGREEVQRSVEHWPEPAVNCKQLCSNPNNYAPFDDRKWDHPLPPPCATLCPQKGQLSGLDQSFPTCLSILRPVFGRVTWKDWIVAEASTGYQLEVGDPRSNLGPTGFSSIGTAETPRPESQCTHLDSIETLKIGADGPVVLRVPKELLKRGIVGACVMCNGKDVVGTPHPWDDAFAPTVKIQAAATGSPMPARLAWLDNQTAFDFESGHHGAVVYPKKAASCWTLADLLDCKKNVHFPCDTGAATPALDAYVHITCPAETKGGVVQYFWVW